MTQVIARRYRPQTFDEVIGQEPIVQTLKNAIESGRIGHGFIFSGHRGIGKTTVARILAKALNCRSFPGPTVTPCGTCEACREIRDGGSVDVIEIDAASNRGIDEIRTLRDNVRYRPARDRYKFYILDEAHQLTDDAFNALLKTLEEPPEWAVFVLATTEPDELPATIRSRCQQFSFRAVTFAQIMGRLRQICDAESIPAEDDALGLIAEEAEGSMRDALSLLDQAISFASGRLTEESARALLGRVSSRRLFEILQAVAEGSARQALERTDALLQQGVNPAQLCRQLVHFVRNALVAQVAGADSPLLEVADAQRSLLAEAAALFSEQDLSRFLQILLRTAADLRYAHEQRLHLELGVVKLIHASKLATVEEVLASLGGSGSGAASGGGRTTGASAGASERRERTASPAQAARPTAATAPGSRAAGPEPKPLTSHPAAPAATSADAVNGFSDSEKTQAVLNFLAREKRTSLVTILQKADWVWLAGSLELVFTGEAASRAKLAANDEVRRQVRDACLRAMGAAPTVTVTARPDAQAEKAAQPEPSVPAAALDERAQNHPLLKQLRERLPARVLRTSEYRPEP
jgi:DNA polymerase-3 subunit gamma/tau